MFTGLVETLGTIEALTPSGAGTSGTLVCHVDAAYLDDVKRGDSIAVNGCCLTATNVGPRSVAFDVSQETWAVTNLGRVQPGATVNLEKALAIGSRLGGHLVSGHVDGLADLISLTRSPEGSTLVVSISRELSKYTVKKGSAVLDGISLTINDVVDRNQTSTLSFMIIPETMAKTTLGQIQMPWSFNLEVDMMAKFAERINLRC